MQKLPPGKYIRAKNGTIHAYNPYAETVSDVEVITVTADQVELADRTTGKHDHIGALMTYLLEEDYPKVSKGPYAGKPDGKEISKILGFEIDQKMIQAAMDEADAITAQANAGE